ncbi:MAG: ABC transporter ATP-binding protein, partial [Leucobacter sp.]|nr:ABC transporter ATP-binding protein [Leucobacter sp.]
MSARTGEPAHRLLARIEELSIVFPGAASPAVDRLTLQVAGGEIVALVGESGSGKSLTARALLGLLPDSARTEGEVRVAVREPAGDALSASLSPAPPPGSRSWSAIRGRRVGLVPQDALGGLDPLRRIEHEVGDALRLHRIAAGRERRDRVRDALTAAGMPDPARRMRQRADELSGGLRQRALLAAALIAAPGLIVADEPTTALDAGHRARVLLELRRRADAGAGVLLISHDLTSVRDVADRVLVMRHGRLIESGAPERVLVEPQHPFTRELLAAAPRGKPRGTRLLTPELDPAPATARTARTSHQPGPAPDAAASAAPRLELRGISASHADGGRAHPVLEGVSLAVAAGETVGLVGESGSGKTTLLRIALGLHAPDDGAVLIDGIDRAHADRGTRRRLRRRVAFVPQDPLDSFPVGSTGRQLLGDALRAAGLERRAHPPRIGALADEVGLALSDLERPAATLSGGQRQRLA